MAHKKTLGVLAAMALTASSVGVAAGPASAGTPPPKPTFVKVKAEIDKHGDLDIAFKEINLRSGKRVRVIGEADVVRATYAVPRSPGPGVDLQRAKALNVQDKFKARAYSFTDRYRWYVKGKVELKHPELMTTAVPPVLVRGATLIKVVYKGVDLTDVKTGAHFVFPTKIVQKFKNGPTQ